MDAGPRLPLETQRLQGGPHHILEVRLPDIDDVVNLVRTAKRGSIGRSAIGHRHPSAFRRRDLGRPVSEVLAREQSELPQLVGNVLADIGDGSVRAHDHLVRIRRFLVGVGGLALRGIARCAERRGGHHPAAGVLACVLQVDRAPLLEQFERRRPKAQLEDLALARKEIVGDADAPHRCQVAGHDRIRDHRPELGNLALAGFQSVQGLGAPSEGLLVLGRE